MDERQYLCPKCGKPIILIPLSKAERARTGWTHKAPRHWDVPYHACHQSDNYVVPAKLAMKTEV